MSKVHVVTIAEAVETMTDWLTRHYHQREANLARDPVAVYAQAQFEPNDVFCYQELNDWTRENSEVVEVFPEYAAAYADLLTACEAATIVLEAAGDVMHHRGFNNAPIVEAKAKVDAAIAGARGYEQEGE